MNENKNNRIVHVSVELTELLRAAIGHRMGKKRASVKDCKALLTSLLGGDIESIISELPNDPDETPSVVLS